jgi:hypothetical protein
MGARPFPAMPLETELCNALWWSRPSQSAVELLSTVSGSVVVEKKRDAVERGNGEFGPEAIGIKNENHIWVLW